MRSLDYVHSHCSASGTENVIVKVKVTELHSSRTVALLDCQGHSLTMPYPASRPPLPAPRPPL